MSTLVDESCAQIARRVRLERESRGWSLADLSERSAVAKATLSKIEREEASPTAVVLVKIAGAFDLTLAGLLLRAEGEAERLSRAMNQPVWRDPETGYVRRQVLGRSDHPVEIVAVELPAGKSVVLPASSYARIRQAVMVQNGELVIVEGGLRHEMKPGDCLGFGAPSEVTFANESSATAHYLVVLCRS